MFRFEPPVCLKRTVMIIRENKQEVLYMLKESISGFCMALADSVPGVSGGTVAFIMGFYDFFDI